MKFHGKKCRDFHIKWYGIGLIHISEASTVLVAVQTPMVTSTGQIIVFMNPQTRSEQNTSLFGVAGRQKTRRHASHFFWLNKKCSYMSEPEMSPLQSRPLPRVECSQSHPQDSRIVEVNLFLFLHPEYLIFEEFPLMTKSWGKIIVVNLNPIPAPVNGGWVSMEKDDIS